MVVIITDQHSSILVEEFNELNAADKRIRVFVFVAGSTNVQKDIEKFACSNGGIATSKKDSCSSYRSLLTPSFMQG